MTISLTRHGLKGSYSATKGDATSIAPKGSPSRVRPTGSPWFTISQSSPIFPCLKVPLDFDLNCPLKLGVQMSFNFRFKFVLQFSMFYYPFKFNFKYSFKTQLLHFFKFRFEKRSILTNTLNCPLHYDFKRSSTFRF